MPGLMLWLDCMTLYDEFRNSFRVKLYEWKYFNSLLWAIEFKTASVQFQALETCMEILQDLFRTQVRDCYTVICLIEAPDYGSKTEVLSFPTVVLDLNTGSPKLWGASLLGEAPIIGRIRYYQARENPFVSQFGSHSQKKSLNGFHDHDAAPEITFWMQFASTVSIFLVESENALLMSKYLCQNAFQRSRSSWSPKIKGKKKAQ